MSTIFEKFIEESNRIEGVYRNPTEEEIEEFHRFMELPSVSVYDLEKFVSVYQPNAVLRRQLGMNVQVGGYVAPPGGPKIEEHLYNLLEDVKVGLSPYETHIRYEKLHPFIDGNGRSGRMLWAWQMGYPGLGLGFLHAFYYQTLANSQ